MTGDLDSDDFLCGVLAEAVPSILINIDYSLSPDAKVPTQLNECLKVYKWVCLSGQMRCFNADLSQAHQNASSYGGDPNKFYTGGGSAGGMLALQIANKVVASGDKKGLKGIAAVVPCTTHPENIPSEYASQHKSYEENKTGVPIIDRESMDTFYHHAGVDPKNSDTFTILATDNHKNYPAVYFVSCEKDPLRDDAYVMEAALKKAGVQTKHDHYKGLPRECSAPAHARR
jgi:versiconal hemiacetal acetate esterase